ncbi:hypothetical protein [Allomuricauda sp. R78024]|uniref:hypothetical protein n=1 Tax=Allomuricauda sp. R78024 TaxID=3093867 RepID=UPI0037C8A2CE
MKRLISRMFLSCSLIFISCDDVFEEDISDDTIVSIAPKNEANLTGNAVQFRWSILEGADNYHLQIIGNQQKIVLDSLVETDIFEYQIDPGTYQWRVRGENFAYVTPYTFVSVFTINSSEDLTNQLVTLTSPANNVYLNSEQFSFSWQGISTADSYHFRILEREGTNETQIFEDIAVVDNSINLNNAVIANDAEYIWEVKAQNDNSSTSFFRRSFFIDRLAPPIPSIEEPDDEQNFDVDDEVSFSWDFEDSGAIQSVISGTIEIASDQSFNTIILSNTGTSEQFSTTFTSAGTFYWRVYGEDEAGNKGDESAPRSFTIN